MREKGRREGRPLIVAMSFRPVIPQRVARQQSPPPLHRLRTILRLRGAPCQSRAESLGVILGQAGWGKETEVKDTELYAALLGLSPPWGIREVRLDLAADRVDVWIEEAAGAKWSCPECGQTVPLYDHTEGRQWRHLDTCHCQTYLHARLPRVECPEHGVRQVAARWAGPGSSFTVRMESRLIDTLKECDVTGVMRLTGSSWDAAWGIVEKAVARGLARKERRIPPYLCVDEKAFAKRHRYETVICDAERGTVEYVVEDRSQESVEAYYRQFTPQELAHVRAVGHGQVEPLRCHHSGVGAGSRRQDRLRQISRPAYRQRGGGQSSAAGAQGAEGRRR